MHSVRIKFTIVRSVFSRLVYIHFTTGNSITLFNIRHIFVPKIAPPKDLCLIRDVEEFRRLILSPVLTNIDYNFAPGSHFSYWLLK